MRRYGFFIEHSEFTAKKVLHMIYLRIVNTLFIQEVFNPIIYSSLLYVKWSKNSWTYSTSVLLAKAGRKFPLKPTYLH